LIPEDTLKVEKNWLIREYGRTKYYYNWCIPSLLYVLLVDKYRIRFKEGGIVVKWS
jgi:hypothetical protein